jgi:hypothetical protein
MTIYVWHLSTLSLVIAAGIFTFDGAAFSFEPGTAIWWITRPIFYLVLIAVTLLFVAAFGIFERDIDTSAHDRPMPVVLAGMIATIVALGATAFVYLVDKEANITWWIPALAFIAALLVGAYPNSWNRGRLKDHPDPVER